MSKLKKYAHFLIYIILTIFLISCDNSAVQNNSSSSFSKQQSFSNKLAQANATIEYVVNLPNDFIRNGHVIFSGQTFDIYIFAIGVGSNESVQLSYKNAQNNPYITYNPSSCEIDRKNYFCHTIVEVAPNTPNESFTINIKDARSIVKSVSFTVESPILLLNQPNPKHIAVQSQTTIGVSLYSVPTYNTSGSIPITLSTTVPNIISIPSACVINYANGVVTTNTCANIPVTGINNGRTSIIASSPNFKEAISHFITVGTEMNYTYVTNMNSNNLFIYNSTLNGLLTALNSLTQITGNSPNWTTFDPSGHFAYITNAKDNTVSMYKVEANGALTPLDPPTIATGSYPVTIAFEPTGRFAYVTNQNSNNISVYNHDQTTGILTPLSTAASIVATGKSPVSVTTDPSGQYLYVTNYQSNNISMFKISQISSYLAPYYPTPTVQTNGGPFELVFDPSGKYAYVPNSLANSISVYTKNPNTGALTFKANIENEDSKPDEIRFEPQGRYAYVTNQMSGSISMYSVNPDTGMLSPLIPYQIQTGTGPIGLTFDATGQYLYVTNSAVNTISMYSFNPQTGMLTSIGTPIASGQLPIAITVN